MKFDSEMGQFAIVVPDDWAHRVVEDDGGGFAVEFDPPGSPFRVLVRRFRTELRIKTEEEFEHVVEGTLMGLEEVLRPMKVLERKLEKTGRAAFRADLVLRGKPGGIDVMQRRRVLQPGQVPPASLFLLTALCPAESFLVHRRTFEELFDAFAWTGKLP